MAVNQISKVKTLSGSEYNLRDAVLRVIDGLDTSTTGIPASPSDTHIASSAAIKAEIASYPSSSLTSADITNIGNMAKNILDGSTNGSLRTISSASESGSYTIGIGAFAEGPASKASGTGSHSEGCNTVASDTGAHAEGASTTASGEAAHSEGASTTASGAYSHAGGTGTVAQRKSQTVIGEYNLADTSGTVSTRGDYAFIIGNGTANNSRSNALTVKWNGDIDAGKINGKTLGEASEKGVDTSLTSGSSSTNVPTSAAIATYVDGQVSDLEDYIDQSIEDAIGSVTGIEYQVVQTLPQTGSAGIIYLVSNSGSGSNIYDEYIYYNSRFEKIGSTDVDLSGYISGSGTSGYIAKFNGSGSITNGPSLGSSTTEFLRNDGTWAVPPATDISGKVSKTGDSMSGDLVFDYQDGVTFSTDSNGTASKQTKLSGTGGETVSSTYYPALAFDKKTRVQNIQVTASDISVDNDVVNKKYVDDAVSGAMPTDNDTKNTAGATDTSSKIYLIGATTQGENPQTYSHDTAYVGTDGKLYSNGHVVLTGGSNAASAVTITPATTDVYSMTSAGSVTPGSANVPTALDTSKFSGGSFTSGAFSQGTLPTLTLAQDSTDTSQLNITFTQGTLPTHASDSFTGAAIQTGFYTPGVAGTPTAVTLPGRSSTAIKAWTGYTAATADAQVFTGSTN